MVRAIIIAASLVALTACGTYRPLYGPTPDGQNVSAALAGVNVIEQRTRTGQLIRNELMAGPHEDASKFELKISLDEKTGGVSATPGTVVVRKRYSLSVQYELIEISGGGTLTKGTSFANVSYDTVREPVADLQAADAARNRASSQVGQDLKQRLAAYFASHKVK
jgi:LPS-assembly lipoprotein